jgi:gingipain K
MKKLFLIAITLILCADVMAQQKIQLRSVDKAECVKSDMTSLKASFSFSTIAAQDYATNRGTFSWLSLPNTVIGGNEGDPQIPVVNELIAVPFGATPRIEITSYSTTDYRLEDYDMKTLVPRQPSLRKDKKPEDVPFIMNETAYQSTRGFRSEPMAVVEVAGTMRGVQLGKMTIEPVSYDPVNNTLRVFNDIVVEVYFDDADRQATEDMLVNTYSPYFDIVYKQLFNGSMIRTAYEGFPDLYTTPVKMLVVTTTKYTNSEPFQTWLAWKKQKGIDVDVQTVTSSTNGATIRSLIQNRYNANHPTFLVIVGDENDVTNYETYNVEGNYFNPYVSDNPYASVDNDIYHDMYMSRMAVSNVTELSNLVQKILTYEKYTMSDPSYLDNAVLIAGYDANGWDEAAGRPTIQYALNSYFNTANGFSNVYGYVTSNYTGCYDHLNTGVGFVNYTAHGSIQAWSSPSFTNTNANALTNSDKYFLAVGNCCLAANWGNSTYTPCLGETLIRSAEKGAFGYIGSVVETYWFEDYYFGVGAHDPEPATVQTVESTMTGMYDALFDDTEFNSISSIIYIGNAAVTYAHAAGYEYTVDDEYYWRAYQCLGDGSVMPYMTQPTVNQVSHASTLGIGMNAFTVSADPGSYVSITKDDEILGVAQVGPEGSVNVPITPVTTAGDVMIVVTRSQRQPYIQTIQAVTIDGIYITVDSYTPTATHVGEDTDLSIVFKNVGSDPCSGTTTVTLSSNDAYFLVNTKTFNTLAAGATTTVSGFRFHVNAGVAEGTAITLHYSAVNGSNIWEGDLVITVGEAELEYKSMAWNGGFVPGETLTLTAKFLNTGHYQATNAIATMSSTSSYVTISNPSIAVGTIPAEGEVSCTFNVTIAANCPEDEEIPVTFTLTADGGLSAQGNETLKNSCIVIFDLHDSYSGNDGWNGAKLTVSFNDGTPSQDLTIASGNNSAVYPLEIHNGTHVTLTWSKGSYDQECSFVVSYEGDVIIFQQGPSPAAGVLFEFDCNCGAATAIFNVTATSSNSAHGTVSGGGEFGFGEYCTLTATPAVGYFFTGWTENGVLVSTANPFTFPVDNNHQFAAGFGQGLELGQDEGNHEYLPCYSFYEYALSQQIYTAEEIGSACTITSVSFFNKANTERTRRFDLYLKHTDKSAFSSKTDWITMSASDKVFSGTVTMGAVAWTTIVLDTPFEYDGTSNLVLVFDDNTNGYDPSPYMSCSVYSTEESQALYAYSAATDYNPLAPPTQAEWNSAVLNVKNHLILGIEAGEPQGQQSVTLSQGWNWWSSNVEITLEDLEAALVAALPGATSITIKSQNKNTTYNGSAWRGSLNALDVAMMYEINVPASCTITLTGSPINPSEHPVTINANANTWIGYPFNESKTLVEAFGTAFPVNGDIVKSKGGSATYSNGSWRSTSLTELQPGQGYIYKSASGNARTLIYGTNSSK